MSVNYKDSPIITSQSPALPVAVEARTLSLSYRNQRILRDVSLAFASEGSVAITGPSGSGKTTLLYALSGLERDVTGTVKLLGEDLSRMSADSLADFRLRNIGFVFQSADLVPELTLRQNIALPLELARVRRREVHARVAELVQRLGLTESADRHPSQVSGGQAQRCAVARAVVAAPRLVFADEPTGALDQSNRDTVLRLLMEQVREIGGLLVMVTHDQTLASEFDRRVALLDGQLITAPQPEVGLQIV